MNLIVPDDASALYPTKTCKDSHLLLWLAEKTIKALMEGKIDPEEIDKKERALKEKQRQVEERRLKKLEDEERRKRHVQRQVERKKWGFVGRSVISKLQLS
jgi:hypothetical protein